MDSLSLLLNFALMGVKEDEYGRCRLYIDDYLHVIHVHLLSFNLMVGSFGG